MRVSMPPAGDCVAGHARRRPGVADDFQRCCARRASRAVRTRRHCRSGRSSCTFMQSCWSRSQPGHVVPQTAARRDVLRASWTGKGVARRREIWSMRRAVPGRPPSSAPRRRRSRRPQAAARRRRRWAASRRSRSAHVPSSASQRPGPGVWAAADEMAHDAEHPIGRTVQAGGRAVLRRCAPSKASGTSRLELPACRMRRRGGSGTLRTATVPAPRRGPAPGGPEHQRRLVGDRRGLARLAHHRRHVGDEAGAGLEQRARGDEHAAEERCEVRDNPNSGAW